RPREHAHDRHQVVRKLSRWAGTRAGGRGLTLHGLARSSGGHEAHAGGRRRPWAVALLTSAPLSGLREKLLVRRLQQRDERAFKEVVGLYQHKVFNLVYRMVGNREEAEDVAQEVFVTLFKSVDTFRGESKFSTWL